MIFFIPHLVLFFVLFVWLLFFHLSLFQEFGSQVSQISIDVPFFKTGLVQNVSRVATSLVGSYRSRKDCQPNSNRTIRASNQANKQISMQTNKQANKQTRRRRRQETLYIERDSRKTEAIISSINISNREMCYDDNDNHSSTLYCCLA